MSFIDTNIFGRKLYILTIFAACIWLSNVGGVHWSSEVNAGSTSWTIYRESDTLNFHQDGSVEGDISPIEINGRILSPYHSYYADIDVNDVRLSERIAAREGYYRTEEDFTLNASAEDEIKVNTKKPLEGIYTITYEENWPTYLGSGRFVEYYGQNINYRDFAGNNRDVVGTSLLYNQNLLRIRGIDMGLEKLNATVLATVDSLRDVKVVPTRLLNYSTESYTTGIADLEYKVVSSQYDIKNKNYPYLLEGSERYYGTYDINRHISINASFNNFTEEKEWLKK